MERLTKAGMLMFGKTESIIDEECVSFFFPNYRELPDKPSSASRWIDCVCQIVCEKLTSSNFIDIH